MPSYDTSCALIFLLGPYGLILWLILISILHRCVQYLGRAKDRHLGSRHGPSAMDHSYLIVVPPYDMSCASIILTGLYGWDSMVDIDINPSSMGPTNGVWIGSTLGVPNWTIPIGLQLFGSSAIGWYAMCIDFHNGTLWVRFHGWYWYQSFIDGSNIQGVHRTILWGPEIDHPSLGRSYLVIVPSYDMPCALIFLTGPYGLDFMADIDMNPSSMGQYLGCGLDRHLGSRIWPSAIGPQLFGSHAVVWYAMCLVSLNWSLWVKLHVRYWYQSFIDGSNIWGVDRIYHWDPETDHPPLDRSCLVVETPIYIYGIENCYLHKIHGSPFCWKQYCSKI